MTSPKLMMQFGDASDSSSMNIAKAIALRWDSLTLLFYEAEDCRRNIVYMACLIIFQSPSNCSICMDYLASANPGSPDVMHTRNSLSWERQSLMSPWRGGISINSLI